MASYIWEVGNYLIWLGLSVGLRIFVLLFTFKITGKKYSSLLFKITSSWNFWRQKVPLAQSHCNNVLINQKQIILKASYANGSITQLILSMHYVIMIIIFNLVYLILFTQWKHTQKLRKIFIGGGFFYLESGKNRSYNWNAAQCTIILISMLILRFAGNFVFAELIETY